MKLLLISISLLTFNLCLSQTQVKSLNVTTQSDTVKVMTNQPISISISKGEEQKILDNEYYLKEIERIDYNIKAINEKIDYVKDNEIVDSKWLMDMEKFKFELEKEKLLIIQKLNKQ